MDKLSMPRSAVKIALLAVLCTCCVQQSNIGEKVDIRSVTPDFGAQGGANVPLQLFQCALVNRAVPIVREASLNIAKCTLLTSYNQVQASCDNSCQEPVEQAA